MFFQGLEKYLGKVPMPGNHTLQGVVSVGLSFQPLEKKNPAQQSGGKVYDRSRPTNGGNGEEKSCGLFVGLERVKPFQPRGGAENGA